MVVLPVPSAFLPSLIALPKKTARAQTIRIMRLLIGAEEVPLPSTVIINKQGRIVWYGAGPRTVSEVRKLLEEG